MDRTTRAGRMTTEGWVETMTEVARDEAAHLAQVTRILLRRGGRLDRCHKNPYANALRQLVAQGEPSETLDRLLVSALIEVRSCERFAVLAAVSEDAELAGLYHGLFCSEFGHYKAFRNCAKIADGSGGGLRWYSHRSADPMQQAGARASTGFSA
jgi:tRNA-(ms[2]io[6]A)-hydroxylase